MSHPQIKELYIAFLIEILYFSSTYFSIKKNESTLFSSLMSPVCDAHLALKKSRLAITTTYLCIENKKIAFETYDDLVAIFYQNYNCDNYFSDLLNFGRNLIFKLAVRFRTSGASKNRD